MSADRAATILARFQSAHNALVGKLRELPPESAEKRPASEAWSAAQVGFHVATTNEWIAGVLDGSTPMAAPAPFRPRITPTIGSCFSRLTSEFNRQPSLNAQRSITSTSPATHICRRLACSFTWRAASRAKSRCLPLLVRRRAGSRRSWPS